MKIFAHVRSHGGWGQLSPNLFFAPPPVPPTKKFKAIFTARCTICIERYWDCMSSVRLSVRLSATLVDQDHISWKSWKLIARTITPNMFALRSLKAIRLLPGEHGEILGRLEVGLGKVACWRIKAAISLKRVNMDEKLLWRADRNSPTLFRTVPSPTNYGFLFSKIGGSQPKLHRYYLRNG